jgi:hypothetical protein
MLFSWVAKLRIMTPEKSWRHHGYLSKGALNPGAGTCVFLYLRALTGKLKGIVAMEVIMKFLFLLSIPILLTGCISFNSSEATMPAYVDACANREQQCREVCGNAGVQGYSCSARPGEGINFKCECRKPGQAI